MNKYKSIITIYNFPMVLIIKLKRFIVQNKLVYSSYNRIISAPSSFKLFTH